VNALLIPAFAGTSFVLAILSFPILIKLLHRWELLDHPADHKIHSAFTPSMGGVCILGATCLTLLIAFPFSGWAQLKFYFIALAIIFVTGLRDDMLNLTPLQKLLGQLLPVVLVVAFGDVRITSLYGLYAAPLPEWASWVLSISLLVVLTNAYNLIDGIDGLAGVVSLIIFSVLGSWFFVAGDYFYAVLSAVFAGAIAGFLYYNWQPSRIFMGDTGTLPIGFTLAVLLIAFLEKNVLVQPASFHKINASIGAAVCLFIIPVFDTVRVVILRALKGQSPFKADRNHLHHQLLRIGLSHAHASLTLGFVNAAFIGLAWFGKNWSEPLLLALIVACCLAINFVFRQAEKMNARKN